MGYTIQRLTFGGILDQSLRLYRDHFVPMTLGFVFVMVPQALLMEALGVQDPATAAAPGTLLTALGVMFVAVLLYPLVQIAVYIVIADAYLSGPATFGSALSRAKKLYLPYLGTTFLAGLLMVLAMLLLVIPGIYFAVCWMLIGAVAVVEGVFGSAALKRSRALVRGYWWRTLGVVAVAMIATTAVTSGLGLVFSFIPVVGTILGGIAQAVAATYNAVVLMLLYVDLRCRHEDFDLRHLAQQVAATDSAPPPAVGPDRDAVSA